MKCFLHIGTEKTGSSYLQCRLALSREALLQQNLCFSKGAPFDEQCMRQGRISGGNALKLAGAIGAEDWRAVDLLLRRARQEAEGQDLDRVLLSSELILSPLLTGDRVGPFLDRIHSAGLEMAGTLLILRDPQEQFISLYKHRAKGGTAGDIASWAMTGYRLPGELALLRLPQNRGALGLTVRKYEREPGSLDRVFFEEWLGIPTPETPMPAAVNPSLTLSELVMISQLAASRADLVLPMYLALLVVPMNEKARDDAQKEYARAVGAEVVASHAEEWVAWNQLLPPGEQLAIPEAPEQIPEMPTELAFSERQIEAIAGVLGRSATPAFLAEVLWRSKLRPALGRAARAVGLRR